MVPWAPLCMEPDEWADWQRLNPRLSTGFTDRPCTDCPVTYAREMRGLGRCNGTPGGRDSSVADSITVELAAAPCPTCLHRNVCAMRARLEAVTTLEVERPLELPKAITVRLTAIADCSEYLRDKSAGGTSKTFTPEWRAAQSARMKAMRARQAAEKPAKGATA